MARKYVRFVTPKAGTVDQTQDVAEVVALDAKGKPVTMGGAVAKNVAKAAGDAPTKAEFDALIDALTVAGLMASE